MKTNFPVIFLLFFFCYANTGFSQGFVVAKSKTQRVEVELLKYKAKVVIDNNIAHVEIDQEFFNPSANSVQANYYFVFPAGGRVNSCTLELEGAVFGGELMEKKQSTQLCFAFIKDGFSPSFFDLMDRQWFQVNAYQIPAKEKRSITFKYSQILNTEGGLTRLDFPRYPGNLQRRAFEITSGRGLKNYTVIASTAVSLEGLSDLKKDAVAFEKSFKVTLLSDSYIKNIYSPNCNINIDRKNRSRVNISVNDKDLLSNDLVLYYAQDEKDISCNVLSYRPDESKDGYFMLLASPLNPVPKSKILPKDIIFVLDVSGSMAGEKLKFAQNGLKRSIKNLNRDDYFNIITYGSAIKIYQKNLVKASEFSTDACEYVEALSSGGGTNINAALLTAFSIKPKYDKIKQIIFITDGVPTVGVTDTFTILENVKGLNAYDYQIHTFAIKNEVDAKLLQSLTSLTSGHSEYVQRLSQLSDRLVQFIKSVKSPVLGSINFSVSNAELRDVFGNNYLNIYQNAKIIIVGRYKQPGQFNLYLSGNGQNGEKKLQFDITFAQSSNENIFIKYIWQKRKLGFSLEKHKVFSKSEYEYFRKELSPLLDDFDVSTEKNDEFTGEKVIARIETLKSLKEAVSFNQTINTKTKNINNRIFKLNTDGYWQDTAISLESKDSDHGLHLKYGGKAYFDLAKEISVLRPFLALGNRLDLSHAGYHIKIDKYGLEEISRLPF